jgi:hypothetical protein
LPDDADSGVLPGKTLRYIVFAQNAGGIAIEEPSDRKLTYAQRMETVSSNRAGYGYYVTRIDGDPLSVASLITDGEGPTSIRCKVWRDQSVQTIQFDNVPLNPTGPVTTSMDLDVPSLFTHGNANEPGHLIGIADLSHPEWGFWQADGTPLPAIPGLAVPRESNGPHPQGNITRRIGFLFRGRRGSSDRVSSADASGVLLASSISTFNTESDRYDLNAVFLDPNLSSMTLVAKVPKADRVVAHLKLKPISPSKEVAQFFANRISPPKVCYGFNHKLAPPDNGVTRSLQFLYDNGSTHSPFGVSTDWEDGAVAVSAERPQRILAANVLEHSYVYSCYGKVSLYPRGRR